jgi:CheY-like chemotaxis protein
VDCDGPGRPGKGQTPTPGIGCRGKNGFPSRDRPCILCTAYAGANLNAESALESGADAFLAKPLEMKEILATVQRVLLATL